MKWSIEIQTPFGGFAPAFWKGTYQSYGNKNQAADLQNVNLINPTFITQGPGLANLTNGTEVGAVTTLLKGILDYAAASDVTYGVGGAKLYKLSSTTVTSDVAWPHIIDKAVVTDENGEDVAYYQGKIYYSYNHSGNAGDIGQLTLPSTFVDDWGCYSEDTDVFTIDGWKKIKNVEIDEKIYSLNPQTFKVEIVKNQQTINKPFNGDMIKFNNEGVDLLVTPDHKMYAGFRKIKNKKISTDWRIIRADSLLNKWEIKLKKNAVWDGKIIDEWEIPEYDNGSRQEIIRDNKGRIISTSGRRYYRPARKFPIRPFLRLLGFYISEGSSNEKCINIAQQTYSKGWQPIKDVLDELGLNYGYYGKSFDIHDKQLTQYIRSIIPNGFYNKRIPKNIMELHPSLLKELFEALMFGDGSGEWNYFTSSPYLRDDFIELANRLGWSAHYTITCKKGEKAFHGIATADCYRITINKLKNETSFNHHKQFGGRISKEFYNGNIVCLVLEKNHIMLVRRNGKSVWCGNSTVPIGAGALTNNPHQMIVGGNDFLYIANGFKITSYDGTTLTLVDLDLPDNCVVSSIAWTSNRLWIAANQPNLTGTNKNIASIYVWDGNSPSWEDEIRVMGRIGALKVKNGIVFVFYEDISSTGGYKLGYVSGTSITDVAYFTGSLPLYYQVTEYENFLIWVSGGEIWAWGSTEKGMPAILFQLADGGYSNVGGLATPFGTPIVASYESTTYRLAKFSGYDTACYWYSLLFQISITDRKSMIDKLIINIEKPSTNARVDWTLKNNQGTSLKTGTISYASDGAITKKIFYPKCVTENCRLEFDWSSGNAINPLNINSAIILGHTIV